MGSIIVAGRLQAAFNLGTANVPLNRLHIDYASDLFGTNVPFFGNILDQRRASGPSRIPPASTQNAASHAEPVCGPPNASSAAPTPQDPKADKPKPTVECIAIVAPRLLGSAAIAIPAVRAPESAGTVIA
jgi:hypothetical protein